MNLFRRIGGLFSRKAAELTYDQIAGLIDGMGGGSFAGVRITRELALQVSTVLSCVRTIADGCATPRLHVYREKPDGSRERATNIPEYRLLARRPLDRPDAVHVVQLEHALIEGVRLAQVGKVQGHDLGTVSCIRAIGPHGLCAAAHLAEDVDVIGCGCVEAPRAAPAHPALAEVIKVAIFHRGGGLLIITAGRGRCEAEGFGVVLVLGVVHQIPLERMRRPTGAGW